METRESAQIRVNKGLSVRNTDHGRSWASLKTHYHGPQVAVRILRRKGLLYMELLRKTFHQQDDEVGSFDECVTSH